MPKWLHPRLLLLLQLILPLLLLANSGTLAQQQEEQPKEVPSPNEGGVAAAEQSPSVAAATLLEEDQQQQQQSKCGTKETDFAPCVGRERADEQFKHCCSQYVPAGCQPLCQYEPDELTARNMLLQAVKSKKCDLKHFGTILYCASQNQDNRQCCQHLNLADSKLGVGERCLRFCDPGGGPGIESIARADVTCLFNWNVLMYCHHSGIKLVT